MEWPEITILLVTYDRIEEITRTIKALCTNLYYAGNLKWHLADDSSPGDYIQQIKREFTNLSFTYSITARKGWGANVNRAMLNIRTDYIFLCEDDYVAKRDIDLSSGVALMEANQQVGLVRYDGISGHTLTLSLKEDKVGEFGRVEYLEIFPNSPHLNVYSNRPHLKHRRFHQFYGLYREARIGERHLGMCESSFAHRIKDMKGGPKIVALWNGIECVFDHIGKSRQLGEFDIAK